MDKVSHSELSIDDDQLIKDTLAGRPEAFGTLMQKHQSALFALALRVVRHQEEAEDVVQQAFVEAYRHLSDFRGGSQFSTWLYSITLNRARNYLRSRKVRQSVAIDGSASDEDTPSLQLRDTTPLPEQILEKQWDLDWIRNEVQSLSSEYQAIFQLHYFQNLPLQEVAKRLGRPVGTVKVYLHRARKELYERASKLKRGPLP